MKTTIALRRAIAQNIYDDLRPYLIKHLKAEYAKKKKKIEREVALVQKAVASVPMHLRSRIFMHCVLRKEVDDLHDLVADANGVMRIEEAVDGSCLSIPYRVNCRPSLDTIQNQIILAQSKYNTQEELQAAVTEYFVKLGCRQC